MKIESKLKTLSDDDLLRRLTVLLQDSRRVEADLVAHIAEVDARRLYAREATPSMFAYCTERLHLSEPEAYLRIAAARASRRHPILLTMLADGRLHLSGIERLAPHLTDENCAAVLRRAEHRSKRQIEELVAELAPCPDVASVVRRLPAPKHERSVGAGRPSPTTGLDAPQVGGSEGGGLPCDPPDELRPDGVEPRELKSSPTGGGLTPPPARPTATVQPLSPARYKVQFTCGPEVRDTLERLQALMRSSVPDGDIAKIIQVALAEKLERLETRRFGKTRRRTKAARAHSNVDSKREVARGAPTPSRAAGTGAMQTRAERAKSSPTSRHIPAAVRRHVYARDGGRCVYRDKQGRRCTSRHDLEFHHRYPHGYGGEARSDNVALMCRAHNTLMAEVDYGMKKMAGFRRSEPRPSHPAHQPRQGVRAGWPSPRQSPGPP